MNKTNGQASLQLLDFLRNTDTCTVSNAIETFRIRMRNEGYVQGGVRCMFPRLPAVAGYAVTGRMRSSTPPIAGLCYYHRLDWWQYISSVKGPKIIVIEDVDPIPGSGALFGELHTRIGEALGCVAYVTNGAIRDLAQVQELGFQCFAQKAAVSHSYAHITEFGEPVVIGGLKISPGDLLHGDCNGVQSVPGQVYDRLPDAVAQIKAHESELTALCKAPDFSIEKLERALIAAAKWSPAPLVSST